MNEEIEKSKKNFPNDEIPDLLIKFYTFLTDNKPSGFLDYETIVETKYYLESLINKNIIDEFLPFYVDNSHAIFSFWLISDNKNLEQQPIVFMDTEGTYSVCANNLSNFFCLISLNLASRVCTVFNDNVLNKKMGWEGLIVNPYEKYNEEELREIEIYNIQNYPDFILFSDHVKKEMNLQCPENPIQLVEKAFNDLPNLEDYIRNKDGFVRDPR
jgi:hypothetical protein